MSKNPKTIIFVENLTIINKKSKKKKKKDKKYKKKKTKKKKPIANAIPQFEIPNLDDYPQFHQTTPLLPLPEIQPNYTTPFNDKKEEWKTDVSCETNTIKDTH